MPTEQLLRSQLCEVCAQWSPPGCSRLEKCVCVQVSIPVMPLTSLSSLSIYILPLRLSHSSPSPSLSFSFPFHSSLPLPSLVLPLPPSIPPPSLPSRLSSLPPSPSPYPPPSPPLNYLSLPRLLRTPHSLHQRTCTFQIPVNNPVLMEKHNPKGNLPGVVTNHIFTKIAKVVKQLVQAST